jgi:hypothetical protein
MVSDDEIKAIAPAGLVAAMVACTDGWQAYRVLNSESSFHTPTVTGSGKNAARLFPGVHTSIANIRGNIHGVYHVVCDKYLPRYLGEFCYRFNRCFWEPQMFNRIMNACVNDKTVIRS